MITHEGVHLCDTSGKVLALETLLTQHVFEWNHLQLHVHVVHMQACVISAIGATKYVNKR